MGIISGTYGIGGGSIIAPFLIAIFGLPVYAIAGAALLSTFRNVLRGKSPEILSSQGYKVNSRSGNYVSFSQIYFNYFLSLCMDLAIQRSKP
ncbi:MAG: sulfite exporter TauE/SafE family protein [Deltaproteobacteria bacterium]|nr:sulfite exporter TauE/SafE family protein [Deltaproteobacteria bacterium]